MKQRLIIQTVLLLLFGVLPGQGLLFSQDLDGAAAIALQGDLPDTGFFAESNSFSRNSTINVTNLDNGKTVQVVVAKGLEASGYGFLLTLSRDAADAIGIYGRDVGRIRVTLPIGSSAFSRFNDGRSFSGDPDYDPRAFVRSNLIPFSSSTLGQEPVQQGQGTAYSETVQPFHTYTPAPDNSDVSAPVAVVAPYHDPSETEVILRSPTVVITAPLPELGEIGPPVSEGTGTAYTTYNEPDPVAETSMAAVPYSGSGETNRYIAIDEPSYTVTDTVKESVDEPVPVAEVSTMVIPRGSSETSPYIAGNEPSYIVTERVDELVPVAEGMGIAYIYNEPDPVAEGTGTAYTAYSEPDPVAEAATMAVLGGSAEPRPYVVKDEPSYTETESVDEPVPVAEATTMAVLGDSAEPSPYIVEDEPGYVITESETDTETEIGADAGEKPSDDGGQVFDTALAEPGYRFTEAEEAGMAMAAESGLDDEHIALGEPWYTIGEEDIADAGEELSDDGRSALEAALAEPGYRFTEAEEDVADAGEGLSDDGRPALETALAEPGYRFANDEDTADTADMATEDGLQEEWSFNEPMYTEMPVDSGSEFEESPQIRDDAVIVDEPGYLIIGVGGGEDFPHDTMPPIPTAERTDFPVNEPWVNIVENVTEIEFEEEVPPATTPPLEIQPDPGAIMPPVAEIEVPSGLEKGKYYVQIGGYASMERLNAIVRELSAAYPLVVMGQRYILIGPLNEGESNALEQQFRVRGYPNAFVVRGNN
jgi:hypothetical protein